MVFIVAVNFFENYGHSGVSTAVEMYGTVVLVIFLRLLQITVTVDVTAVVLAVELSVMCQSPSFVNFLLTFPSLFLLH